MATSTRVPRSLRLLRLAFVALAVAMAAGAGFVIRWARRGLRLRPRVTHGICPLHSLRETVLADRLAGSLAQSVVLYARQSSAFDLTTESDFDKSFSSSFTDSTEQYWRCLCYVLLRTDIWSTTFRPFLPAQHEAANSLILAMMKLGGIKIVAFPYGADVAWRDRHRDRYDWVGKMQLDYPDWDLVEWGKSTQANVRIFSRHADIVIGMDGSLRRFLTRNDIYCKTIPVDTERLRPVPNPQPNPVPVIVHAPNHRNVKGTHYLMESLDTLRRKGVPFELRVIEGVQRNEALKMYQCADIVADQFVMGAYGVFALECLALGKPVLGYLDHDHLSSPVFNLPIVNTNRENLTRVLGVLLRVPELRQLLGAKGRDAVVRYHSLEAIGELNKVIYEHVWRGVPLELDTTAHFDSSRSARSFTEDPADDEFWPVEMSHLREEIAAALLEICGADDARVDALVEQ